MQKSVLCLLILVSLITAGCIPQPVNEPVPPAITTSSEPTVPRINTSARLPTYDRRIGVGATTNDWFAQQIWPTPLISWEMINPIPFLATHGFNWLRAGVTTLSNPELESGPPFPQSWDDKNWCSREYTLQAMKKAAKSNMHLCLFFNLSDKAAYIFNQKAPAGWENYTLEETALALKRHTFETTKYYKDRGLKIEVYEIGNEIDVGICGYSMDTKLHLPVDPLKNIPAMRQGIWEKEAFLLKSSIEGVKQADPEAKIMLHIGNGQYPNFVKAFFQAMIDFEVPYDFAGLSYYQWTKYNPDIPIADNCLELSVQAIAELGKKAIIAEFAFPNHIEGDFPFQDVDGYPLTIDGQTKWVRDFLKTAENNLNVEAVFYFYPEACSGGWPCALFSDDEHPVPAIYEFTKFQSDTEDTTPPLIYSIFFEPAIVRNGDILNITAKTSEAGLYVTADISHLDPSNIMPVMLKEESDGVYKGTIILSAWNETRNGIKSLAINATDTCGNTGTETGGIQLKNLGYILDGLPPHDNFEGAALNTDRWKPVTSGGGNVKVDGRLVCSTNSKDPTSGAMIESTWDFNGDFDVQVDFQIVDNWTRPSQEHIDGAVLGIGIAGQNYQICRMKFADGGDQVRIWTSNNTINGIINTGSLSGMLRLVRSGYTLTLLYDIGEGWKVLSNGTVPSGPANVFLGNRSINASHTFTTCFSRFTINSGVNTYKP